MTAPYACALAAVLSELRTVSGVDVVRTETETELRIESVTVWRVPSTDDALADVLAARAGWAVEVMVCSMDVGGKAGEA